MTRKLVIAACLLAGILVLVVIGAGRGGHEPEVDVAEAGHATLADTTLASGNLVFETQIQLRPEVSGRVADVLVEEGDEVEQGQLLMYLDRDTFAANLTNAEAGVEAAQLALRRLREADANLRRQLERHEELQSRQLVSRDAYDQLRSRQQMSSLQAGEAEQVLAQQRALRDQAADQLRRSEFRAPIAGRVIAVDIKPGETVIAGTTNIIGSDLMTLADTGALLAELRVDEADIARIRTGQQVEVFAASSPSAPIPGKVVHIGSSARQIGSAEGLAFRVRVLLDDTDAALAPGVSCRAEIITAQGEPSVNVPVAAVRRDDDGHFVWRLEGGDTVRRTAVEPGLSNDIEQALQSGLEAGQRVVTGPGRVLAQLADGQRVKVGQAAADGDGT
ncbi:MAG: efflux RND transporter periplasmic adaptor subunit [Luteimonas sp.]